jgi:hypothetical protein
MHPYRFGKRYQALAFVFAFLALSAPYKAAANGYAAYAIRNAYSSTNVTTSAYLTLVASTSGFITHMLDQDTGPQTMAISWAATCGALAVTANTVYAAPGGAGSIDVAIPSGWCIGIKAISANATSNELDITFFR